MQNIPESPYVLNMDEKMQNPEFLGDTTDLLRPMLEYDSQATWERVRDEIVAKLLPSKQVKDRKKGQNPY